MWQFLVDESMPRSTAVALRRAGHPTEDVRDVGLRGRSDQEVYDYAQARQQTLITADKDFANVLRFPPGTHAGIIVLRVPDDQPTQVVLQELLRTLGEHSDKAFTGLHLIVEPRRTRIRWPSDSVP